VNIETREIEMSEQANRVVVGIDGSDESKRALRWAQRLAQMTNASIDAVMSWNLPTNYGWSSVPVAWNPQDEMEKLLTATVDEVLGTPRPETVRLSVREGPAAKVLLDAAADATLLVVGSRGHGGFAGLLLGSVSASVAEHATCPVLVVHGDQLP
jgi:nucleotide-binding universal stress UspA family protein